jgi:hypothetical protein
MIVWSPGMRDEAAIGMVRLLSRAEWAVSEAAPGLRAALRVLSVDPNPLVRMQAAYGLVLIDSDAPSAQVVVDRVRARILDEQDIHVLAVHLRTLASVTHAASRDVDRLLEDLASRPQGAVLHQGDSGSLPEGHSWAGREAMNDLLASMIVYLAVVDGAPFSANRLSSWLARPMDDVDRTTLLIHHLRRFLNPVNEVGQQATFSSLTEAARVAEAAWRRSSEAAADDGAASHAEAGNAARVSRDIAQQLFFASGAFDEKPGVNRETAQHGDPEVFATFALPLLRTLGSVRYPQVTQPVVETLIHVGRIHPREALLAVADAVPDTGPYVTDSLAGGIVVPFLARLLAENRDLVLGTDEGITAFRHLLQAFAGAGDADALALAYTFSDAFR